VLSWNPPSAGATPTGYVLEVGSVPGASDLLVYPTGSTNTSYTASGVHEGVYYVRVHASSAAGASAASNEVAVVVGAGGSVPGGSPPLAPGGLIATSAGSNVLLIWSAPVAGARPTFYIVEAGSAPGLSDLAVVSTGGSATSFSASGVGSGTYYVRVRSANSFGVSAASATVTLVVGSGGGTCAGPPAAPAALRSEVSGSTVTLAWIAAAGNPTSYVIEAGSRPGATDAAQSDTGSPSTSMIATGVGAGTYFVRVRARNACGTSGPSNEMTVVVR
jgi:predicted phage tail protein